MADPAVVDVMREFKRGILAREASQMQVMAKQWLNVEGVLQGNIVKLAEDIAARKERGEVVSESKLYQLARYQSLVGQTQREFGKYADWSDKDLSKYQRSGGQLGIDHASTAIQMVGVGVAFDRLPYEAVENMVGYARNGMPLNKLLRLRMVKDARGQPLPGVLDRLTSSLITGTALGRNPRDVAKDMRDDLSGGLAKALTIARTEGLRPYKEMSRSQYEKSGVVSGHRRLSAHDGRVCGACLADEGTLFSVRDSLSDHPNGRCTSVPVVKGMPEVDWLKGEDWLKTQSEGVQRSILGGARFEMWSQKLFNFSSLVQKSHSTVWGSSITPTPAYMLAPPKAAQAIIGAPIPPDLIPAGWVTRNEAADRLGVSTASVSQLTSKGELEAMSVKVGNRNRRLISIASINAYLAKKGKKPPKPSPGAWLTVPEAASRYPLSVPKINELIRDGKITWKYETLSPGRITTVVDPSSIDAYLASIGKVKPPKPPPKPPPPMAWVKVSQAASLLGFNTTKVRALIKKGELEGRMIQPEGEKRSVMHVAMSSIDAYLAKKDEKPPTGYFMIPALVTELNLGAVRIQGLILKYGIKPYKYSAPGSKTVQYLYLLSAVRDAIAKDTALPVKPPVVPKPAAGVPKGYVNIDQLLAISGLDFAETFRIMGVYNVPDITVKGFVYYREERARAAFAKEGKAVPTGWATFDEAEKQLSLSGGTASKLAARYGLTTKWDKKLRRNLINLTALAAAAQKAGVRKVRSLKEKQEEAAEVRGRILEEYPTKPLVRDRTRLIQDHLEVPTEERTTWKIDWKGKTKLPTRYKKGIAQVSRLVSRKGTLGSTKTVEVRTTIGGRAYNKRGQGVVLSAYSDVHVTVHEMGHELEEKDPEIHKEAVAFLRRRTKGEKLAWLGNGYDKSERTRKDKFLDVYMGKSYRVETEIVSMGLQYFSEDPWTMAKKDPDMFDFIYSVVRE